ncbi:MAG: GNAT family N-acetyltransferase [Sphingobacteriales bacterium]|nr:GNAT family N-acetyltransferase [Sphingobacteriales bacterium]MBI3718688.1 GNAT family N-acetyltransferase [Sphingobacteriales bacterium]
MLTFNLTPFPKLETNRLLLRQLTEADADRLFFLRSDAQVLKYIFREPASTIDEINSFIQTINRNVATNENPYWAIALKEEPGKLIGTICIWNIRKEHYRAELGYVLHPNYWGKGMMKEAIQTVIDYGFNQLHLHSMEAVVDPGNIASVKTLESCGFVKEAHFKEDSLFRDQFKDTAIYSLLNKS